VEGISGKIRAAKELRAGSKADIVKTAGKSLDQQAGRGFK